MADILKWSGYTFCVKPTFIQGIRDITIKSSSETEDSTEGEEKYVKRKNAAPHEINFTALLNRYLGVDVKTTAIGLLEAARKSEKGYIYMAGAKLLPCQFMAISADVGELEIAPNGTWISCEVRMSMKQCSKYDVPPAPPATTTWRDTDYGIDLRPTTTQKVKTNSTTSSKTSTINTSGAKVLSVIAVKKSASETSKAVLNDANKKVPTGVDVVSMAAPKASAFAAKVNTRVQTLTATAKAKVLNVTSKIVSLKK